MQSVSKLKERRARANIFSTPLSNSFVCCIDVFCLYAPEAKDFYLLGSQQFLLVLPIQTRHSLHWPLNTTTQSLSSSVRRSRWYSWDPYDWSSSSWVSYSEKTTRETRDFSFIQDFFFFVLYKLRGLLSVSPPERSCLGWRPPPADSSVGLDTIAGHLEDREQPIREQTATR